jgi:membrane protein implicated in regulation of membrane protease activity
MQEGITTRDRIAIVIYLTVLFGVGLVVVLNVPLFAAHPWIAIPVVVLTSLILGMPLAWLIAPWLRARKNRRSTAIEAERSLRSSPYHRSSAWLAEGRHGGP